MSAIGFDIGNESCVIAAANGKGVDVLWNDEWKHETPAVVSFGKKQRNLGSVGALFAAVNPKSTVSQIKRLIGKLYKEVERDLKLLPFATSEGPRGGILIELEFLKKKLTFTPMEIMAMLFKHLKQLTEKNLESNVVDCVIGIPSYFTDLQRRLYLDAAHLAGLKPLRLMHDGTAIALGYAMYKTDFSELGPTNVMFVDIGHCDTQVTLAAFEQGGMKVLSHTFDQNLGGRDFDEVLFKHFATQFNQKYKIDIYSDARASVRLMESCERVKKVLSGKAEALLSIECLIGDTDVIGVITRDEFEKLSSTLLERVIIPCNRALKDSGLRVDKIHTIELVGSGSRIPAITKYLTLFFEKDTTRTLNASECVARGCAHHCAMLSPTSLVRDYKIEDSFPYSIVILVAQQVEIMLFPKGGPFPNYNIMNYSGKLPIYIQVAYKKKRDFPTGISHIVGHFRIGSDEFSNAQNVMVEFKMKLNNNGIVELESAVILEDKCSHDLNTFFNVLNLVPSTRVLDLPVTENIDVSTTEDELHVAKENEKMLVEQDMEVEETKDQRNTLESFVYDTRNKLSSSYKSFVTASEKNTITKTLQETEDWLYEDSDDESEQDYSGRLKYLKKLLEPIESRYIEEIAIAIATKAPQVDQKDKYKNTCTEAKVNNNCTEAEQWLINSVSQKHLPQETLSADIIHTIHARESNCESKIRSKSPFPSDDDPMDIDQRDQNAQAEQKDRPVDPENHRTKEIKDLETCIAKYRSHAETLPDGMKAKVYNVIRKAEERYDNIVSQNHSSPKTLATEIIRITKSVVSNCERIIRSESSSTWHEEPDQRMDSGNARRKATKLLQTRIAEYRLKAESLPADKKDKVFAECNNVEVWLKHYSYLNATTKYIIRVIETFKSNCESIIN